MGHPKNKYKQFIYLSDFSNINVEHKMAPVVGDKILKKIEDLQDLKKQKGLDVGQYRTITGEVKPLPVAPELETPYKKHERLFGKEDALFTHLAGPLVNWAECVLP